MALHNWRESLQYLLNPVIVYTQSAPGCTYVNFPSQCMEYVFKPYIALFAIGSLHTNGKIHKQC